MSSGKPNVIIPTLSFVLLLAGVGVAIFMSGSDEQEVPTGQPAPAFSVPWLGASDQSAGPQDYRGNVVILDFWATYCEPCRRTMPALQDIFDDYASQDLTLLSVNVDGPDVGREQLVSAFLRTFRLRFPVLMDNGSAARAYSVSGIPHIVLVDRAGRVRLSHVGVLEEDQLRAQLDDLLAEPRN
ncbi:MAG: TlpA family protein disulfide reductase [Myxococcales bacterium]|nr:TlpA family protein disulfide reductase [Myxococcales bacterium]